MDSHVEILREGRTVYEYARSCLERRSNEGQDDAFYVCNLGSIVQQHKVWCDRLPRVKPFYAVKCNPDVTILRLLASLGLGFDCASKNEIKAVLDLGVSHDRIVYANTRKALTHLEYAAREGVYLMTFDDVDELYKIKQTVPNARLLLRIKPKQFRAEVELGTKFGLPKEMCERVLEKARELSLEVVGVSFHVGSNSMSEDAFPAAIDMARDVFDMGTRLGMTMTMLDIGGGYSGGCDRGLPFKQICEGINGALDLHFPEGCGVDIISEPGRYYVTTSHVLVTNVIGTQTMCEKDEWNEYNDDDGAENPKQICYLNDGYHGGFARNTVDNFQPDPVPLTNDNLGHVGPRLPTQLWGPTCDSSDRVCPQLVKLPKLQTGDWILFKNMGAYTRVFYTNFNGFPTPHTIYVIGEADVDYVHNGGLHLLNGNAKLHNGRTR